MTNQVIPEEAIQAALERVVHSRDAPPLWIVLAILEAAAPTLMAQAWSEGWDAGAGWPQQDINPYDATK